MLFERPSRRHGGVDSSRERHVCRGEAVEERYPLEDWKQEQQKNKPVKPVDKLASASKPTYNFSKLFLWYNVGRICLNITEDNCTLVIISSILLTYSYYKEKIDDQYCSVYFTTWLFKAGLTYRSYS